MVNSDDFRRELNSIFTQAEREGLKFIDIRSGDLHNRLGDYPGPNHRMPICCSVMRSMQLVSDKILASPPKGNGANLIIRYYLPRESKSQDKISIKSENEVKPQNWVITKFKGLSLRYRGLSELNNLEELIYVDPKSAILKIRSVAEKLSRNICKERNIPPEGKQFSDLCVIISNNKLLSAKNINYLNSIRKMGNAAAHDETGKFTEQDALILTQEVLSIVEECLDDNLI